VVVKHAAAPVPKPRADAAAVDELDGSKYWDALLGGRRRRPGALPPTTQPTPPPAAFPPGRHRRSWRCAGEDEDEGEEDEEGEEEAEEGAEDLELYNELLAQESPEQAALRAMYTSGQVRCCLGGTPGGLGGSPGCRSRGERRVWCVDLRPG
jgi:hypothetical protein